MRLFALAALCAPVLAHAEPRAIKINIGPTWEGPDRHINLPATPSSRLIYVHRCPITGCIVRLGADDSRTDTSSIAKGTLKAFTQGDDVWNEMMACVRATYAPFNIGVTDVDPGNVPHYEHMVGGRPGDLGFQNGVGGVAPFDCGEIPNAISYTFDVWGPSPEVICGVVAQETAHAFGLTHELNPSDPLTYLNGPYPKRFQPTDSQCGEFQARACECGGTTQNSVEHLLALFGAGVPTPPVIDVKYPTEGRTVQPGFTVKVDATDDLGVASVEIKVDGASKGMVTKPPYNLVAPRDIAEGPHALQVIATDVRGTTGAKTVNIVMGPPCTAAAGCSDGDVCVAGGCVAGPDRPGGIGSFCQADTECLSGRCVSDTEGNRQCVEACDVNAPGACPNDFECVPAGATGVCWMTGGTGCCESGRGSGLPAALFGLGVLALAVRRRR